MTLLIIDSFAGGGGASTGIEMALGRSPDIAINHSADALAMHAVNHPETRHLDSNIWDVSPLEVTGGRRVGLFWASPDCKHFSKAKGGKPLDRNIRDLAWIVARYVLEAPKPFIVKYQTGSTGHAIDEPLATVTANSYVKRPGGAAPLGVVVPSFATLNHGGGREHAPKGLDEPFRTLTAARDAHALIAPVITAAQHGGSVRGAGEPLHTIAASPKDQNAVIVPTIVGCGGRAGQSAPRGGDDPLGTLTAKADGCVVAPYLVPRYQEREGQSPRIRSVEGALASCRPSWRSTTTTAGASVA